MQKITPFLWFDDQAEQAAKFYVSIFKRSKILSTTHYGDSGMGQPGKVMTVTFRLEGQKFVALNGGPHYKLTPAFSLFVSCKDQREVDYFWKKLAKGGQELRCGWVTDKFGVSWQIIPDALPELLGDDDAEKSGRVMQAMLKMVKLDVKKLKQAHAGK